jgi:hypothetical protein
MLLTAIFFVSFATLAFEVLLTRVFAIGQWNHLSFMVISIALFGFGASGSFLSLYGISNTRRQWRLPSRLSISMLLYLYSISAILSFLASTHMPLDYFRLPVEPLQSIYLLAAYLGLSVPFFISGLIIALGYTTAPEKAGLVYFASMAGSAVGAIAPVVLLPLADEGRLVVISAAVPLIPAVSAVLKKLPARKTPHDHHPLWHNLMLAGSITTIAMVIYLLTPADPALIQVVPSPYKALGQILQFPQTQITESKSGIRGRIDRVKTPYVRYAPGLSLKYMQALPHQQVIYKDGDDPLVLYDLNEKDDSRFATYMLSFAGYALASPAEDVLLIQRGGGSAVPCALASGAERITLIEPNRTVALILERKYPRLKVINQDPRVFLAQNKKRYDIIHIENWGATIPGAAALNQDHTYTIQAFREYWDHLKPDGIISLSRKLLLPPSDSLRLWSTAYCALQGIPINNPRDHLALMRNFDTFTLLVSKSEIEVPAVMEFARIRNFDLVFLKGMNRNMANKYHVFETPYYHSEVMRLAQAWDAGRQGEFFNSYLLDVRPQSDRRPFPGRFMKWLRVNEIYASLGSRFYALYMSGEAVVLLVFIEALILASFLLILPVVLISRKTKKQGISQVLYFLSIGAGFMFIELYFIKLFVLILGDPIISFTMVVSALLISSSLGGLIVYSDSTRKIRSALLALIAGLILVTTGLELMAQHLLTVSGIWRYLIASFLMLPVGLLMGLPLPLGMHYLLENPVQRAYAWAVNGCASVLSAIIAAQIALSFGIPAIAASAIAAYLVALIAVKKWRNADG